MTLDPGEILAIAAAVAAQIKLPPVVAPLPRFLTYEEAAEQLRCSTSTVREMAKSGKLRRVYPTGDAQMPRIPLSELDRIAAGRNLTGVKK